MNDKFDENQDIIDTIMNRNNDEVNDIMNELDEDTAENPEENFVEDFADTDEEEDYDIPAVTEKPKHEQQKKKSKKKKKKRRKHSHLPGILILVTLIFGVSIISSMVIIGYGKDMLGIDKSEETHLLVVPEGATTEEIEIGRAHV